MKVFIWHRVKGLTNSYHSDGGLVVVAATLEAAREFVQKAALHGANLLVDVTLGEPDRVLNVESVGEFAEAPIPEVFVFPDTGCC